MLSRRCMKVRESIEQNQSVMLSLLTTLGFLTRFIDVCPPGEAAAEAEENQKTRTSLPKQIGLLIDRASSSLSLSISFNLGPADPTRLLSTAKSTELFGTVSMLAGCVVPIGRLCVFVYYIVIQCSIYTSYVRVRTVAGYLTRLSGVLIACAALYVSSGLGRKLNLIILCKSERL